jgi:hypothetical protein
MLKESWNPRNNRKPSTLTKANKAAAARATIPIETNVATLCVSFMAV